MLLQIFKLAAWLQAKVLFCCVFFFLSYFYQGYMHKLWTILKPAILDFTELSLWEGDKIYWLLSFSCCRNFIGMFWVLFQYKVMHFFFLIVFGWFFFHYMLSSSVTWSPGLYLLCLTSSSAWTVYSVFHVMMSTQFCLGNSCFVLYVLLWLFKSFFLAITILAWNLCMFCLHTTSFEFFLIPYIALCGSVTREMMQLPLLQFSVLRLEMSVLL